MTSRLAAILAALLFSAPAVAQVDISDPWVRATVPNQKATGVFMKITAPSDARLVEVRSPLAEVTEIHEMAMVGDRMRMRAVQTLSLPGGETVELKPGGLHLMLLDLKAQAKEGDTVQLFLVFETKDGKSETVEVGAPVRPLGRGPGRP